MEYTIKSIKFQDTLSVRQQVMWPNKPLEFVRLPQDEMGRHYGLYLSEKLISVISVFEKKNEIQFRKFVTLSFYQGKGFGSKLLQHIFNLFEKESIHKIWCNARVDKIEFYKKFGLKETSTYFSKNGINYVIMERFL